MKRAFIILASCLISNSAICDIINVYGNRTVTVKNNLTFIRCKYSDIHCATIYIPFDTSSEKVKVYLPNQTDSNEGTTLEFSKVTTSSESDGTLITCLP